MVEGEGAIETDRQTDRQTARRLAKLSKSRRPEPHNRRGQ